MCELKNLQPPEALYLHIPFCFHKCHYCDFFSVVEADAGRSHQAFTDALLAQARAWQPLLKARTLFAGGGTPTFLNIHCWRQLLQGLQDLGALDHVEEFTVEANPETLTPELLDVLVAGGVNRLSIGAQSFDTGALKTLERWHNPDNVGRSVTLARKAGIQRISLDLIFAIPGQTLQTMQRDLDAALALTPEHLSTYGLTYEPQTALTARLRAGRVTPVDEDIERQMYEQLCNKLIQTGFEHYEISNWARCEASPGTPFGSPTAAPSPERCQHNLTYWQNQNWLALGPGGASHLSGHRWKWRPNLAEFLANPSAPPVDDHEHLPALRRQTERLMLALRLREGLPADEAHTICAATPRQTQALQDMLDLKLLAITDNRLHLTQTGLPVADSVLAKLI